MKLTRRQLLLTTAAVPAACAGLRHGTAPDRRDDDYWGKLSKELHVTGQEVDEHKLMLDDQWHQMLYNQDVYFFIGRLGFISYAQAHDTADPEIIAENTNASWDAAIKRLEKKGL